MTTWCEPVPGTNRPSSGCASCETRRRRVNVSMPTIPNITPEISLTREDAIVLLLSSIAREEMALAHIMNAEAEKLQYVLGMLDGRGPSHTLADVMKVNESVLRMMNAVTVKEVLLQLKLSNVMELATRVVRH